MTKRRLLIDLYALSEPYDLWALTSVACFPFRGTSANALTKDKRSDVLIKMTMGNKLKIAKSCGLTVESLAVARQRA